MKHSQAPLLRSELLIQLLLLHLDLFGVLDDCAEADPSL
jgi:hypothetical protein